MRRETRVSGATLSHNYLSVNAGLAQNQRFVSSLINNTFSFHKRFVNFNDVIKFGYVGLIGEAVWHSRYSRVF